MAEHPPLEGREMRYLAWLLAVSSAIVTGCAVHRTPVQADSPGVGRAELELLPSPEPERTPDVAPTTLRPEAAPETLRQSLPAYPPPAVDEEVACTARILYHMETDGTATLVELTWGPPPPTDHLPAFESAIEEAVASWRFNPAYQLIYEKRAGEVVGFEKRLIPKARSAAIHFRVEGGKGVVE
jgi:hypothetical protein